MVELRRKRDHYRRDDVVRAYDKRRFGGPGGRWVDSVEQETIRSLLGRHGGLRLDLPCGSGRLFAGLDAEGGATIGGDSSLPMLRRALSRRNLVPVAALDAFQLPFADATFDAVVTLRFVFHLEDPQPFFVEVGRVLKPGGRFVFDALRYTPRALFPRLQAPLGGEAYAHGVCRISGLLGRTGFDVVDRRDVFLLPSQAYRPLPRPILAIARRLEPRLPAGARSKAFFAARLR